LTLIFFLCGCNRLRDGIITSTVPRNLIGLYIAIYIPSSSLKVGSMRPLASPTKGRLSGEFRADSAPTLARSTSDKRIISIRIHVRRDIVRHDDARRRRNCLSTWHKSPQILACPSGEPGRLVDTESCRAVLHR